MQPTRQSLIDAIQSPLEPVFALLTDPGRIPTWLPGCTHVSCDGPLKKGSRLRVQFGARAAEFEVVDFGPPRTFGWVERGQRRGWKTFFRLDAAGRSTAVTVQSVWTAPSVIAWVRGRFLQKRDVRSQLLTILENLRNTLMR